MKVLILGSGGREHAVAWKYSKSKRIAGLYIAPGNAGTEEIGVNLTDVDPMNPEDVIQACRNYKITHVFVGPEGPLSAGIVDALTDAGIPAIGPHREAAQLEASKVFSKDFMQRHDIPTAGAVEYSDREKFRSAMETVPLPAVIKKSGLASGKGVLVSEDRAELLAFGETILKEDSLLVEECLQGLEASLFAFLDGETYKLMPFCADFKRAYDNDEGPNTGGMGAICPVPIISEELMAEIRERIVEPTIAGLKKDKLSYKGILYFGLMLTSQGPKVLEYNVRLGDPEAQVLLPLIESDFGNIAEAMIKGHFCTYTPRISERSSLGVVVAAEGYPGSYEKEKPVKPIPSFPENDALVFHAATERNEKGQIVTKGGRCFTVVGLGHNIISANVRAYEAVPRIQFEGCWHRGDIGKKYFLD